MMLRLMPTASANLMQRILIFLQILEMRFKRPLWLGLLLLVDRLLNLNFRRLLWFLFRRLLLGWHRVTDRA